MNPEDRDDELQYDGYNIYNEDDVPEEPTPWSVDDFDDILDLNESTFYE